MVHEEGWEKPFDADHPQQACSGFVCFNEKGLAATSTYMDDFWQYSYSSKVRVGHLMDAYASKVKNYMKSAT